MRIDNSIAAKMSKEGAMPKGSRHYLRRINFVQGNERQDIFETEWVSDKNMDSDYLGKWVKVEKFKASRAHHLNLRAQVAVK